MATARRCTATSAKAASTCASPSTSRRRKVSQNTAVHRRSRGYRPQVRRLVLRRTRRRTGSCSASAKDVWVGTDAGFRRIQAALGSTEPDESRQAHRSCRSLRPTDNLRIGAGYEAAKPKTWFQFPADNGSFGEATERCVGVGACRKQDHGTMCPSYMATREEKHSTRGRAHLLWEMMQGNVIGRMANEEVREALDLCLSCKACKTECPVNVDMATWKSEFLAHHYEGRLHPLHHYAFVIWTAGRSSPRLLRRFSICRCERLGSGL